MRITAWKSTTASLALAAGIVTPLAMSVAPATAATTPSTDKSCGVHEGQFLSHYSYNTVYTGKLVHDSKLSGAAPDEPVTVTLSHDMVHVTAARLPDHSAQYQHISRDGVNFLEWHNGPLVYALRAEACNGMGQVDKATLEVVIMGTDKAIAASGASVTRELPSNG